MTDRYEEPFRFCVTRQGQRFESSTAHQLTWGKEDSCPPSGQKRTPEVTGRWGGHRWEVGVSVGRTREAGGGPSPQPVCVRRHPPLSSSTPLKRQALAASRAVFRHHFRFGAAARGGAQKIIVSEVHQGLRSKSRRGGERGSGGCVGC
jgi:hypothetical protein